MSEEESNMSETGPEEVADEQRRELVLKLGKLAIYTPPAMLALMVTSKATAASTDAGGGAGPPAPPPFGG
jgi:hypothetical protein